MLDDLSTIIDRLLDYDALLFDLDGTIVRGAVALPGAVKALAAAREHGFGIRFLTNNALKSPKAIAGYLSQLNIVASATEVVTSAQVAAELVVSLTAPHDLILVVGSEAIAEEIRLVDRIPTRAAEGVKAVIQGGVKDIDWNQLAEATVAIQQGARWIACNLDLTLPTERGLLPGNGAFVFALSQVVKGEPMVAGKPSPRSFHHAAQSLNARRPLVIGDRLDTDIAGARNAGMDSLLVLTGVATQHEVYQLPESAQPTYVTNDLSIFHQLR